MKRNLWTANRIMSAVLLLVSWIIPGPAAGCEFDSPPVLSITDDVGSFTLSFSDFAENSLSGIQTVVYRVQANHMASGTVAAAVTAKVDTLFDGAELRGDVTGYANVGEPEFANLAESQPGAVVIRTTPVALADKNPAVDDSCMDGNLTVTWQGRLTKDTSAGSTSRTLTVTLKDGS